MMTAILRRKIQCGRWILGALLPGTVMPTLHSAGLNVETVSVDTNRMEHYLALEAEKLGRGADARISSCENLVAERPSLSIVRICRIWSGVRAGRGPSPIMKRNSLRSLQYSTEVLASQSLPHFYVTANLYAPRKAKPPFPAVIWPLQQSSVSSSAVKHPP